MSLKVYDEQCLFKYLSKFAVGRRPNESTYSPRPAAKYIHIQCRPGSLEASVLQTSRWVYRAGSVSALNTPSKSHMAVQYAIYLLRIHIPKSKTTFPSLSTSLTFSNST